MFSPGSKCDKANLNDFRPYFFFKCRYHWGMRKVLVNRSGFCLFTKPFFHSPMIPALEKIRSKTFSFELPLSHF